MGRRHGPWSIWNREPCELPVHYGGYGIQPGNAAHCRIQLRRKAVRKG